MPDMSHAPASPPAATWLGALHCQALDEHYALAQYDAEGRLQACNARFLQWTGRSTQDSAQCPHAVLCPDDAPQHAVAEGGGVQTSSALWAQMHAGQATTATLAHLCSDGGWRWLESSYTPVRDAAGKLLQVLQIGSDRTAQLAQAQRDQAQAHLLTGAADASDSALLISDALSRIQYVNQGFTRLLGWNEAEVLQKNMMDLVAPQLPAVMADELRASLRAGQGVTREDIVVGKAQQRIWAKVQSNPVLDAQGRWISTITVLTDITPSKMHQALQHNVLEAMARDMPLTELLELVCVEVERIAPEVAASILQVDDQGIIHPMASPSLPVAYSSQLEGVAIGPAVGSCGTAAWRNAPVQVDDIATDPLWADYQHLIVPLGYRACWSTPIRNGQGRPIGTFAFYFQKKRDQASAEFHQRLVDACTHLCSLAMERERARVQIRKLAFYDPLTGLPNKSLLQARAEQAIASAVRSRAQMAVLFINLDRFKQINESLGHQAGDQVLCTVAARMEQVLRASDISGRLSGDEFAVLLPQCSPAHVAETIERLQQVLAEPVALAGSTLALSASMGVAMFPADGRDMDTLLHRADLAMHQSKNTGRGGFSFFSREMNEQAQERLALESALRLAVQLGELQLHYQPQINLATSALHGVEALARWVHPLLGPISPVRFIPLAEETGLVAELGRWAVDEACRQLAAWRSTGLVVPSVSVNLSTISFHSLDLPERIAAALQRHGLQPQDLMLELTESLLLDTNPSTLTTVRAVHALGVQLSMDDFGTGYSSLSYLRRLPVSELKLDRSFVADLENDEAARALSAAILGIGRSLMLTVVAEGVETVEQRDLLAAQGYPVAQGYLFSRPLPPDDFARWARTPRG